jgi:translation initiation factor 1 (eIF-1/SUI1)
MPYSKTPAVQTYETKRINFISNPQQRSSDPNKDFRLVNMMTEEIKSPIGDNKKYYIKSRPGLSQAYTTQTGEGRGVFYWTYGGNSYCMACVGNKVYANGTEVLTLSTSTGHVGFCEFLTTTNVSKLILLDGTNGYVFSAYNSVTQITDPEFPTPHVPTPVYLDYYLFVAKAGTADIYNSDLDDPSSWTAGNYIQAKMYPDTIKALSKNNNFLYAVGTSSVEYFYDGANASGSPLTANPTAVQQFGTAAYGTVVQTDKEVLFVGETNDGGHTVWTIDGFKENEIAIPSVKSALLAEGSTIGSIRAFEIRVSGQKLYVLCLTNRTLVYSLTTKMWSEWQTGSSAFCGYDGTDGPNGSAYILDRANGNVYLCDETYFTDNGTAFDCLAITAKLDFDNINRKFMYRLSIIGDVPDDNGVYNTVYVSWSDNDYKTWSDERSLNFNSDLPAIWQMGQFRRRAIKLRYSSPKLFRIEMIEVDINKGNV